MTEDLSQDVLDALAEQAVSKWNTAPRTTGWLKWKLAFSHINASEGRIKKALEPLLESGAVVAARGSDVPWRFHGKLATSTYYMTAEFQAAKLKEVADAAEARRWEKAADEADLAMRQLHPAEWDALKAKFYKGAQA
jgi:hypothetical protein